MKVTSCLNKFLCTGTVALLTFCALNACAEEEVVKAEVSADAVSGDTVYVSENANVWLRGGPGSTFPILSAKHVGQKLTFLGRSPGGKYIEVDDGTTRGWMQTMDLQTEPCGRALAEILNAKIDDLQHRLDTYDSESARALSAAQQELKNLRTENEALLKSVKSKDETIAQIDEMRRDLSDRLETRELDMQMRWWLQGSLIAVCGALVGVVLVYLPRPARKVKRDRY